MQSYVIASTILFDARFNDIPDLIFALLQFDIIQKIHRYDNETIDDT